MDRLNRIGRRTLIAMVCLLILVIVRYLAR